MARIMYALAFALSCFLLALFVLISDPFFAQELLGDTSVEQSLEPTAQLFAFFEGRAPMPDVFNEDEASHLRDVRVLLWVALALFMVCFAIALRGIFIRGPRVVRDGLLALVLIIAACVLVPFESLFWYFHIIFFPQGNWMFPASSTLITFYPGDFFRWFAAAIAGNALCFALAMWSAMRAG